MKTWTKYQCEGCGAISRVRGKPLTSLSRCFTCGESKEKWLEAHWGDEKYALGRDGCVEINASHPANAKRMGKAELTPVPNSVLNTTYWRLISRKR